LIRLDPEQFISDISSRNLADQLERVYLNGTLPPVTKLNMNVREQMEKCHPEVAYFFQF